ncbi:hypothetical protein BKA82DRAFT_632733 [Pisolithus tinctorius]|uniref:Extracellular membrane protein CFEM domain-containing protein n=1 Tax=Pisolithus tinctorius Marx 270 TaxID=870435 RepID=A0A0C3NQB5_PISTI|nr:hypothetical protein BKA82DRAFT_632733 [Pisolithus tinctorius]KIO03070.1 hypothetical protein M404DRAFT_632733 [Pisolithus tinctorius Marx 270]
MQFALLLVSVALVAAGGARGLVAIDRRQSPVDVPAACTSTCQNVVNEGNAGCPQSQCCTNTFITEYYNCFSCIGSNLPSFDYAPEQTALNQLWAACETAGYSLSPPPALPGQTAPTSGVDAASSSGKTTAKVHLLRVFLLFLLSQRLQLHPYLRLLLPLLLAMPQPVLPLERSLLQQVALLGKFKCMPARS